MKYDQRALSCLASEQGQAPYAFVFSCVDSRSIPEVVFDQPVGALFVARIAGNVVSTDVLGSMEFATAHAGTKLLIVMGHTQCGAVAGACHAVDHPSSLKALLSKITLAVKQVHQREGKAFSCDKPATINAIARQNVVDQVHALYENSPALAKMIRSGKIKVVGAMHNIKTGRVRFFNVSV